MFKKMLVLFLILLLSFNVFSIRLVEPFSKELSDNDFVGSIVPGQTLELIISKEFGRYNSLELTSKLPDNFDISVKDYLDSIKILIASNENTPKTKYFFSFLLKGSSTKSVRAFFVVDDSLLDATLLNYSSKSLVDEEQSFDILLINNSDAVANFKIKVDLPWYWLGKDFFGKEVYKEVSVPKRERVVESIKVFPRIHGDNYFNSRVVLQNDSSSKNFTLFSKSEQTFYYKLESSLRGLPFYSISLAPSLFLNSFFSMLFFN